MSEQKCDGLENVVSSKLLAAIKTTPSGIKKQCDSVSVESIIYNSDTRGFKIIYSCTVEEINEYLINIKELFYFDYVSENQFVLVNIETI